MAAEAYPLHWPEGWPKLSLNMYREHSRFKTTMGKARDGLFHELDMMSAKNIVLSTNVELRRDGLPYASRKAPEDPGAAVYFQYRGKSMVFACDTWLGVENNIQALRKTVEAIRGIERWGASDMMERAFTGFEALPDQSSDAWWSVLGVSANASAEEVAIAHRRKRSESHPDREGGSNERFTAVQDAWKQYLAAA